jgi:trehalose 6-phosphate phosphatase
MKDVLAKGNQEVLAQLAFSRLLIALDYDGTLAPIDADRERALMRPRTATLLGELCARYPCAVISGRSRADVRRRLGKARLRYVVGNHGLEPGSDLASFEREMRVAKQFLTLALANTPGVELEDKRYSLALHYRRSRQRRVARVAIERAIGKLPMPTRTIFGKAGGEPRSRGRSEQRRCAP